MLNAVQDVYLDQDRYDRLIASCRAVLDCCEPSANELRTLPLDRVCGILHRAGGMTHALSSPTTSRSRSAPWRAPAFLTFQHRAMHRSLLGVPRGATCCFRMIRSSASRHATLIRQRSHWFVIDEGEQRGHAFVNGRQIDKATPAPVTTGDLLRIGPWVFRVAVGSASEAASSTVDDAASSQRVVSVRKGRSERRLRALSDCIARLNEAPDEVAAAMAALESALLGSGYTRGAVLRRMATTGAGEVETVASLRADPGDKQHFDFSRTLIEQANAGETVVLVGAPTANFGQSVADLGIHSALCVPVGLGGSVTGYLYLDARGPRVAGQAPMPRRSVSRLAIAYGYSDLLQAFSGPRWSCRQAEAAVRTCRGSWRCSSWSVPPDRGEVGCISYAARSLPGSFVAGDLFDVVDVAGEGVAVCLGDVSGHGVGSAMLMATAQSFLAAELRRLEPGQNPAVAVEALNKYLCERSSAGRFLSSGWASSCPTAP